MKISCRHGFFIFEERRTGELSHFISLYDLNLVRKENYFTFEALYLAPDYSIAGAEFLGTVAIATFQGTPWEVLRENSMVYNFDTGLIVPIDSITNTVRLAQAGGFYVSSGLIMPGSLTDEGSRVTDYTAWFSTDTIFKYSEVTSV